MHARMCGAPHAESEKQQCIEPHERTGSRRRSSRASAAGRREIQSFVPEDFWEIKVVYREPSGRSCEFRCGSWHDAQQARELSLTSADVQQNFHYCPTRLELCLLWPPLCARRNSWGTPCVASDFHEKTLQSGRGSVVCFERFSRGELAKRPWQRYVLRSDSRGESLQSDNGSFLRRRIL